MDYWIQRYQAEKPSMRIEVIEVDVPCNSTCLQATEFRSLLENETFRSRMEVVDSLVELVKEQVGVLRRELNERFNVADVDIDSMTYAVFRLIEYGGNTTMGERLTFHDRVLARGSFKELVTVNNIIEKVRQDQDIRMICDEIKYLIEALWEHFNKNLVTVK
ncbi:hypothetical protein GWK48_09240 [Metallosphaera tengchongensis]|uniref:Uncharacterized protein n=1 Tax=Metallosphaera tengchongensis TaxID=1532350 RepID=A0A6N0NUR4_9CREN|nr:hypothetical protein [Metallosphaera tengchongensis]QKR00536.1 hypothetical protein GWK48_09240 [Metallosphaera tengchongensis]